MVKIYNKLILIIILNIHHHIILNKLIKYNLLLNIYDIILFEIFQNNMRFGKIFYDADVIIHAHLADMRLPPKLQSLPIYPIAKLEY
jgi:hypothetical protein